MNQECKYEKEIIILQEVVPRVEKKVDELLVILKGSNSEGLVSKVKGVRVIQKIQWWWISAISLAILAGAFFVIRNGVS